MWTPSGADVTGKRHELMNILRVEMAWKKRCGGFQAISGAIDVKFTIFTTRAYSVQNG